MVVLILRHRPGAAADDPPPSVPGVATWGAIGPNDWKHRPISEPWANVGDPFDDDDDPFDDDDDDDEPAIDDAGRQRVDDRARPPRARRGRRDPFDDDDDAPAGEPPRPTT